MNSVEFGDRLDLFCQWSGWWWWRWWCFLCRWTAMATATSPAFRFSSLLKTSSLQSCCLTKRRSTSTGSDLYSICTRANTNTQSFTYTYTLTHSHTVTQPVPSEPPTRPIKKNVKWFLPRLLDQYLVNTGVLLWVKPTELPNPKSWSYQSMKRRHCSTFHHANSLNDTKSFQNSSILPNISWE